MCVIGMSVPAGIGVIFRIGPNERIEKVIIVLGLRKARE